MPTSSDDIHALLCQVRLEAAGQREGLADAIENMMKRNTISECEQAILTLSEQTEDSELGLALRSLVGESARMREVQSGVTHGRWEWSNPDLTLLAPTSDSSGLEQVAVDGRRILQYIRNAEWI